MRRVPKALKPLPRRADAAPAARAMSSFCGFSLAGAAPEEDAPLLSKSATF